MLSASFKSTDGTIFFAPTRKRIVVVNSRRPNQAGHFTTVVPLHLTTKGWREGEPLRVPLHAPRPEVEALYYAREEAKAATQ
jgi:hypothetical protein